VSQDAWKEENSWMRTDLSMRWETGSAGRWLGDLPRGDRRERVLEREAAGAAIARDRVEPGEHDIVTVVPQLGARDANASILSDLARVTPESFLAGRVLTAARLLRGCPS
jgi:hypothetical protein